MKILLIAPDSPGIDSIPEIRTISGLHRVQVLNGHVTSHDLFSEVRRSDRTVIHFATHSNEEFVQLSDGEVMNAEDVTQLAKMANAKLVFFNSCKSGRLAHYLIRHGVPLAIHTNVDINDADAWKVPLAFYEYVEQIPGHETSDDVDFVSAFMWADSGSGVYGLAISPKEYLAKPNSQDLDNIIRAIELQGEQLAGLKQTIRRMWITFAIISIIYVLSATMALADAIGVF